MTAIPPGRGHEGRGYSDVLAPFTARAARKQARTRVKNAQASAPPWIRIGPRVKLPCAKWVSLRKYDERRDEHRTERIGHYTTKSVEIAGIEVDGASSRAAPAVLETVRQPFEVG
jgi:hypothetical protein